MRGTIYIRGLCYHLGAVRVDFLEEVTRTENRSKEERLEKDISARISRRRGPEVPGGY